MNQTTALKVAPSPTKENSQSDSKSGNNPSTVFISLALDMSWRLAVIVLVPIIGGFELDKSLKTTPLLTVVGFILAMAGVAAVLFRTLKITNSLPVLKAGKKK